MKKQHDVVNGVLEQVYLQVTVAAPGTRVRVSAVSLPVRAAGFVAGRAGGANLGAVYVGDVLVSAAQRRVCLDDGDSWTVPVPEGCTVDLSDFYVDAAEAGDGVLLWYAK